MGDCGEYSEDEEDIDSGAEGDYVAGALQRPIESARYVLWYEFGRLSTYGAREEGYEEEDKWRGSYEGAALAEVVQGQFALVDNGFQDGGVFGLSWTT